MQQEIWRAISHISDFREGVGKIQWSIRLFDQDYTIRFEMFVDKKVQISVNGKVQPTTSLFLCKDTAINHQLKLAKGTQVVIFVTFEEQWLKINGQLFSEKYKKVIKKTNSYPVNKNPYEQLDDDSTGGIQIFLCSNREDPHIALQVIGIKLENKIDQLRGKQIICKQCAAKGKKFKMKLKNLYQKPEEPTYNVYSDWMISKNHALVYGAGPVGLILAIQLAQSYRMKVTVKDLAQRFERRVDGKWINRQYPEMMNEKNSMFSRRRGQVVTLRDDCVELHPFLIKLIAKKSKCRIWGLSVNIPIRDLQDVLMEYVQQEKFKDVIKLEFDNEGSRNVRADLENKKRKDEFDFVVGCDGAGSLVRELLAPQPQEPANQKYRIQGKRTILGTDYVLGAAVNQNFDEYKELVGTMPQGQILAHFHALLTITQMRFLLNAYYPQIQNKSQKRGIRGFLNIRLSKDEFDSLKESGKNAGIKQCNFTDPAGTVWAWTENKTGFQLNFKQKTILESGFKFYGMQAKENCGFIYLFELKPGYASKFAFEYNNIPIFLCGDAAISHHFWPGRGLNTGMKSVSFLLDSLCYPKEQCEKYYNEDMARLAFRQMDQRSYNFCQFTGQGKAIQEQLSLFQKQSQLYNYVKQLQYPKNEQVLTWTDDVYLRIQELKGGSFRPNNQRGVPVWPQLGLSLDKQIFMNKMRPLVDRIRDYPTTLRYIIKSGRWYRQGPQPEIFSTHGENRRQLNKLEKPLKGEIKKKNVVMIKCNK